ncbi:MAG: PEP-CTERM sorting domain-containing protein [Thermodesulfobacteriota bacterium]|nr:PEP-CTERM sorting domain-containing protein [Thermodesulfobacteriota bacterium]
MRKLSVLLFGVVLVWMLASSAYALPFTFSGSDKGGAGTAIMDISVSNTTLTALLDNTSPATLDNGTGVNAPGITAFGFDLLPETLSLVSWDLTAYSVSGPNQNSDLVTIGGSGPSAGDWELTVDGNTNGIKLDYVPNTEKGVKGALYNPDVVSGEAALPNYYTRAILTMVFSDTPILDTTDPYSPFVRMQNVGLDGEGSLKLPGTPGTPTPEPATMLLFGTGLVGMAAVGRKRLFK